MNMYLQLFLEALIPVALSVVFYILDTRWNAFKRLSFIPKQVIIGVIFGAAAIFGTEFGVNVNGVPINVRDAAPLCAGLLFGWPAGLIAGVIGGVERWFAVLWGVGAYSRVACSVATVFAGVYAALLRKFMFDDKRPSWGFGLACGVVMEVIHMTLLVLTHLDDSAQALALAQLCTLPMVICNAVAVALSIVVIMLLSKGFSRKGDRPQIKKISQRVQTWLLVCVALAFVLTTAFTYILQTNNAYTQADNLITLNLTDTTKEIQDASDENLLNVARGIADEYGLDDEVVPLSTLQWKYKVTEINIVNKKGIIIESTEPDHIGFDIGTHKQSGDFLMLLYGKKELVQSYGPSAFKDASGETLNRKYAGVALSGGGFVQVGYGAQRFQSDIASKVKTAATNRHVGETGYMLIANEAGTIVSSTEGHGNGTLADAGIDLSKYKENERFSAKVYDEEVLCMYITTEGYSIVAVLPNEETFASRDANVFINSYMEVIVFAILFALIYFLLKRLVVDNIRTVNNDLGKIIGGDLNVAVDVRGSEEFSSLSDDINSTVTTLKRYIAETAARIDKELEFAKSIQHSALPSVFPAYPNVPEFDIYATMNTAKEVGGDFYDFYMPAEDKLAFLIADVSGKGIPAAMFMMTAKTMIRGFVESGLPVNEAFTAANERLCESNEAGMFVTAWMGLLDLKTGHVSFVNAGHNPPLIYRKGEGFQYLKSRAGFVLAGMDGLRYKQQEFDFAPGDRIYLYTDGVTEAVNEKDELYSEDRLLNFLNEHTSCTPNEVLYAVKESIDTFAGEAEQFDDITMLMLEYRGKGEQ